MTAPPAPKPIESLADRELVTRYVRRHDEIAFAALVRRHSSLVLGVCQRVLRRREDVEDAFQATFLVLARNAHRVRKRASLASWLHGVAYRTSLRAAESRHRRYRLLQDVIMSHDNGNTLEDVAARHERQLLDEELQQLSDKYRCPLVLHYLEGKTARQVADELKLSVSTVEGRLKRGRHELHIRLARRGVGLSVALAAVSLTPSLVTAAEISTLVGGTIHAGLSYTAGDPAGPLFTHEAARLAAKETIAMSTATTTVTLTAVLLVPLALTFSDHGVGANKAELATPVTTSIKPATGVGTSDVQIVQSDDDSPQKPFVPGPLLNIAGRETGEPIEARRERILAALHNDTQLEYVDTPLDEAIKYIGLQHNFPVKIDEAALKEIGIPTDEPIRYQAKNIKLRTALDQMLLPLKLGYSTESGALEVTSLKRIVGEQADQNEITVSPFVRDGKAGIKIESGSNSTVLSADELRQFVPELASFPAPRSQATAAEFGDTLLKADNIEIRNARSFDVEVQSNETRRIQAALDTDVAVEIVDQTIEEALRTMANAAHVNIVLDHRDEGIDRREVQNLIISNVRLRSALKILLEPAGLGYHIEDEVIKVSSWDAAPHFQSMTAGARRIEKTLSAPTQFQFVDTPLSEAMEFLSNEHKIPILLDESTLVDVGVPTDEPINLILSDVKLDSALDLILRPLELTYIIRDEVMMITTADKAENTLETRVYNLRHFPQMAGDGIDEILEDSIPGAAWKDKGGEGSVHMIEGGMVVTQTQRVHRQIVELLQQLERHAALGAERADGK